ncbi:hypothetical protein pb186bvf_012159 [Paramecium bursaria]
MQLFCQIQSLLSENSATFQYKLIMNFYFNYYYDAKMKFVIILGTRIYLKKVKILIRVQREENMIQNVQYGQSREEHYQR